ncbi:formate dehydrogenase accessory sulfurtransferase FdhD [Rubritalea marina]|uniref:formate dehydrogenase accessory sulfurtransferase FdhD n=1 Tax=Rubritalea marina TaxID=361055 RepID=UPI0003769594|nr:formate dehydrogenase accessory sulfurtransferase FdhD [Rubritalea marina]
MPNERSKQVAIHKYHSGLLQERDDAVSSEEPLQITLDGCPIAVVMRTPGDDADLVRGFLLTEGIIHHLESVDSIDLEHTPNHALVFLGDDVEVDHQRLKRNLYSASSCGICGKASIDSIRQNHPVVMSDASVCAQVLLQLPVRLRDAQRVFASTGGLHAAGLFDLDGNLLALREDVGRHNAIDKVIGWGASETVDFSRTILQLSGRVSFEVIQKSFALGVPIISAISAPSSLAVELAHESGQTLIGFLRPPSFNCYSAPQRVLIAGA